MLVTIENLLVFAIVFCAGVYIARKGWSVALLFGAFGGANDTQENAAAMMGCGAAGQAGCTGCSHADVVANRENRMPIMKPLVRLDLVKTNAKQGEPHPHP